jgi:uncharacterized protein
MSTPLTTAGPSCPPATGTGCHLGVGAVVPILLVMLVALLGGCAAGSVDAEDPPPAAVDGSAGAVAERDEPGEGPGQRPADRTVPALHPAVDDLDETLVTITVGGDEHEVVAKVAATGEERARGLMEVAALPDGVGMLFLFDRERTGGFWMWNTLIELDIAFIGVDGVAHTLATMVPCEADRSSDCPVTRPAEPYRAALEVPGGWFGRMGIEPGAEVAWTAPRPVAP